MKQGKIHIGTSNIVLPVTRDKFPAAFQEKSRLYYYSHLFNSIEINSSFYKIPMPSTLARWSSEVNSDFVFTLKIFKEITHSKALKTGDEIIPRFMETAKQMGDKKACLLLQFPGKITLDYFNEVEAILRVLDLENNGWHIAVEFRHKSWHTGETYELLNEYKAGAVLHDQAKSKNFGIVQNVPFYYFRFHGPKGDYRGSYDAAFLDEQAALLKSLSAKGKRLYVYFNNTMGNAFENAMTLKDLLR